MQNMITRLVVVLLTALVFMGSYGIKAVAQQTGVSSITDEEFFGVYSNGAWTVEGLLDYTLEDLSTVLENVKEGKYDEAKTALLDHFRKREFNISRYAYREEKQCEAYLNKFFTLGGSEKYIGNMIIGSQLGNYECELTGYINQNDIKDGALTLILMAKNKGENDAEIKSRESGQGAKLEFIMNDDTVKIFDVTKDTYIDGSSDKTNFGSEDSLLIKDESDPYTKKVKKGFLGFTINELNIKNVKKIVLKVNGKHLDNNDKEIFIYKTGEDGWDETSLNYINHQGRTFSYNLPKGCSWVLPSTAQGADAEYRWQIPRFYYARPLATEYFITGDEKYASGLIDIMLDFIKDKDSKGGGLGGFPRSIDAANRFDCWSFAYPRIVKSEAMTPTNNVDILKSIYKTGKFLNGGYGGKYYHPDGNWGIIESDTLLRMSFFLPEIKDSSTWLETAKQHYTELLNIVVNEDGAYRESTSGYAMGVANSYVMFLEKLKKAGVEPEQEFIDRFNKLCTYLADIHYPDGTSIAWGDSGYGNGLKSILRYADALNDSNLRYIGTLGKEGEKPNRTSVEYPSNNIAILRSGWDINDTYLFFAASSGKQHKHFDDLGLMLYSQGEPLLIDTGTFTYAHDPASSWLKRKTRSHNTVEVDGIKQPMSGQERLDFTTNAKFDYASFCADSANNVKHTRNVLFIKPNLVLVNDYMDPGNNTKHTYTINWHTPPNIKIEESEKGKSFIGSQDDLSKPKVQITMANKDMTTSIKDGYYSQRFYAVQEVKYGEFKSKDTGTSIFNTVLMPFKENEKTAIEYNQIETNQGKDATATKLIMGNKQGIYYQRYDGDVDTINIDSLKIEAKLVYVENDAQNITQFYIKDGLLIDREGTIILSSKDRINNLSVSYDDKAMNIYSDNVIVTTDVNKAIKIYAPSKINSVCLNEEDIEFTRDGDYIYAVGVDTTLKNEVKEEKIEPSKKNQKEGEKTVANKEENREEKAVPAVASKEEQDESEGEDIKKVNTNDFGTIMGIIIALIVILIPVYIILNKKKKKS